MRAIRTPKNDLFDAALDLIRQGLSVIPVDQNKRPLFLWKDFQENRATAEQLREWFGSRKIWGLAIVTGAISGRAVLDIDGQAGFDALAAHGFQIPATLTVSTPGGGKHFYFEAPVLPTRNFTGGTKTCPLSQVDFRGDGGYAVCPPTPGYSYVEQRPLAPMPDWLRALVIPGWNLLQEAIATAADGTRNDIGFALARKLRDAGFTQVAAEPLLRCYARAVREKGNPPYTESEVLASLESAYSKPAREPRSEGENSARPSQSTAMVELAEGVEMFHTPDQTAYVSISVDSHQETWPVRSKYFKLFLSRNYYEQTGKVPNAQPLADAIGVLEGRALFSGPEHAVHLRVAPHERAIIVDLCNSRWEVVIVDPSGWGVEKVSPVKFRRSRSMLALPTPEPGGNLDDLRTFLNLADDNDWRLLAAWMLNAMRPRGPFPVLCVQGEQGAAKTFAVQLIRSLLDPNASPVRGESREPRDLLITAQNSWTIAFDNLSGLSAWLSDSICRLSTGGGFATRELYSDADEVVLDAVRPVILNGIDAVVTRSDLLDRAILLALPEIDDKKRRSEDDLLRQFEAARPKLFGAALTALSKALAELPKVRLDRLPRMADFALFGTAVERALGWQKGSFWAAYEKTRSQAHLIALDGSPIVAPIESLLTGRKSRGWEGTASELLDTLDHIATVEIKRRRGWPQTPRQLGSHLSRIAPNLRAVGIAMLKERTGHEGKRLITLRKDEEGKSLSALSACQQVQQIKEFDADKPADSKTSALGSKNLKPDRSTDKADNADNQSPTLPMGKVGIRASLPFQKCGGP